MRLLATLVAIIPLLGSGNALAQSASPPASNATQIAQPQDSQTIKITRSGSQPSSQGTDEHFTGSVRIEPLFTENPPEHMSGSSITFESGARTAWHKHAFGQILIVTAGKGWVQQWGNEIQEIRPGDVVWIPPGVKHWHGATSSTSMTHIAVQESLNGRTVEWMEKVTDEQYRGSSSPSKGATANRNEPSAAQKLMGDFDPKLAELTDQVLYGDVWQRPELSQRDRSLITVAALIALNRPEQLRAHLERARANGVTKDEVVEVITHLACYAGWPNAVNAVAIAREVYH
jgi:4-carboxymuconolactone decarboxylase